MVLWLLAGVVAAMGALCYAEVGLLIPKSGGEYPIIYDSYGDVCGFIFAWVSSNFKEKFFQNTLAFFFCLKFVKNNMNICSRSNGVRKVIVQLVFKIIQNFSLTKLFRLAQQSLDRLHLQYSVLLLLSTRSLWLTMGLAATEV